MENPEMSNGILPSRVNLVARVRPAPDIEIYG